MKFIKKLGYLAYYFNHICKKPLYFFLQFFFFFFATSFPTHVSSWGFNYMTIKPPNIIPQVTDGCSACFFFLFVTFLSYITYLYYLLQILYLKVSFWFSKIFNFYIHYICIFFNIREYINNISNSFLSTTPIVVLALFSLIVLWLYFFFLECLAFFELDTKYDFNIVGSEFCYIPL